MESVRFPRRHRRAHGKKSRAQSLVEFTLVAPLLLLIIAVTVDFARVVYAYSAISAAARAGARTLSLKDQENTDCQVFKSVESAAQGFNLTADPNSVAGNVNPNAGGASGPTTPTPGQGYVYIWPAVSTGQPPDAAGVCSGSGGPRAPASQVRDVAIEVQYSFKPWISIVADFIPVVVIKTVSVVQTEY
jgi:Flp pilus assembly protein TadG